MTSRPTVVAAVAIPPRSLRLTGSTGCPRWRGRVHLFAAALAVPAGAALINRRTSAAVILYAAGLVAQFSVSAAYHLLPLGARARRRMRQADHITIYAFTAASITAFCQYAVPGRLGEAVAGLSWAGALAGGALKIWHFDRAAGPAAVLYVTLGWLAAVTLPKAFGRMDAVEIALLLGAAFFYSAGALVLFTRRLDPLPEVFGYHEVWHGAVVAASACYFLVLWGLVGPV